METGGTSLAFASNELAHSNLPQGFQENNLSNLPAGIEFGFVIEDVTVAFSQAVEAGAIAVVNPKAEFHHESKRRHTLKFVGQPRAVMLWVCNEARTDYYKGCN